MRLARFSYFISLFAVLNLFLISSIEATIIKQDSMQSSTSLFRSRQKRQLAPKNSQANCGGPTAVLTAPNGVVTSPNFPSPYPNNIYCDWEIRQPQGQGGQINIQLTFLQLEIAGSQCNFQGCFMICAGDRLLITDGINAVAFCGSEATVPVYTSRENSVYIRFISNVFYSYIGFRLTYHISGVTIATPTTQPTTQAETTAKTTTTTTTTTPPTTTEETTTLVSRTTTDSFPGRQLTQTTGHPTPGSLAEFIICLGDQNLTYCAPYCEQHCDKGIVIRAKCTAEYEGMCRPGCICSADRPVLYGASCITAGRCAEIHRNRRCPDDREPTECMPACTMTCDNHRDFTGVCSNPPSECVPGCVCPALTPVRHEGRCIPRVLCPVEPQIRSITCGTQHYLPNVRITGGEQARRGSWPFAVQIIKGILGTQKYQCGGTVICADWVITAAHCFQTEQGYSMQLNTDVYLIRIGKHARSDEIGPNIVIQKPRAILIHPRYEISTNQHDIALIRLRQPLQMSKTVRPACLPELSPPLTGASCYVVGWGSTRNRGPSNRYLKQARLIVRSLSVCDRIFQRFNVQTNLCAGGYTTSDTCAGDSGGPLLCRHGNRWYVDGITSYGLDCGVIGEPGVYTRVSAYRDWIRQHTGPSCGNPTTEWPEVDN